MSESAAESYGLSDPTPQPVTQEMGANGNPLGSPAEIRRVVDYLRQSGVFKTLANTEPIDSSLPRGTMSRGTQAAQVDWRTEALCRDQDPDLFTSNEIHDVAMAKKVCESCPVKAECMDLALEIRPWTGVWGGVFFSAGKPAVKPRFQRRS